MWGVQSLAYEVGGGGRWDGASQLRGSPLGSWDLLASMPCKRGRLQISWAPSQASSAWEVGGQDLEGGQGRAAP